MFHQFGDRIGDRFVWHSPVPTTVRKTRRSSKKQRGAGRKPLRAHTVLSQGQRPVEKEPAAGQTLTHGDGDSSLAHYAELCERCRRIDFGSALSPTHAKSESWGGWPVVALGFLEKDTSCRTCQFFYSMRVGEPTPSGFQLRLFSSLGIFGKESNKRGQRRRCAVF